MTKCMLLAILAVLAISVATLPGAIAAPIPDLEAFLVEDLDADSAPEPLDPYTAPISPAEPVKIGASFVAGGTKCLNSGTSNARSAANIWDDNSNSWFEHDGWEPTEGTHKWSAALLEKHAVVTMLCVAPRPGSAKELNGYSFYIRGDEPSMQSGDKSKVDLSEWTKIATLAGIGEGAGKITGPYTIRDGQSDIHGNQCVEVPVTANTAVKSIMMYASESGQGNGDILAVQVFGHPGPFYRLAAVGEVCERVGEELCKTIAADETFHYNQEHNDAIRPAGCFYSANYPNHVFYNKHLTGGRYLPPFQQFCAV